MSPQVTRLDRVLDLVTEHESHFREQELRVVDVSRRVAMVEEAVDRELAPLREVDVRAELEAAKLAVDRLHAQVTAVSGEQEAIRADLREALEAVHREQREARADHERGLAEVKAGFKAVLQDMVDRVAAQLESMRRTEFERAKQYASAAELTALAERVATQDADAQAYAEQQKQSLALALAQVEGMQVERDKMKRRVSKLTAFYNSGVGGGGRGGVPGEGSDARGDIGGIENLVARLDEQANETSDLRAQYHVLAGKLERSQGENARLTEKLRAQQHAMRDVERHVSERAQDMSELMSQIGNVVHVQGRAVAAASGGNGAASPSPSSRGRNVGAQPATGSGLVNTDFGGYPSDLAANNVGGLGAAVERYAAASMQRVAEAEHATNEFDRFLDKMKRRVEARGRERGGEGSSRRDREDRERRRDREREKKRGEGGDRPRGHRSRTAASDSN